MPLIQRKKSIVIQISLKFVFKDPIDKMSALILGSGLVPNQWQVINFKLMVTKRFDTTWSCQATMG